MVDRPNWVTAMNINQDEFKRELIDIAKHSMNIGSDLLVQMLLCHPLYRKKLYWFHWDGEHLEAELNRQEKKRLRRARAALAKNQKLQIQKRGEKTFVALTNDGEVEALKAKIRETEDQLPEGIFCYVVFDISEDLRQIRRMLAYYLHTAQFERKQRSVWVSSFAVTSDMRRFVELVGMKDWVIVVEGKDNQ